MVLAEASGRVMTLMAPLSAFKNLDALNVGKVDGEIGRVVARVGIADGYAVNKDGNLVVRTAVDANVRLHTKAAALSDINADG